MPRLLQLQSTNVSHTASCGACCSKLQHLCSIKQSNTSSCLMDRCTWRFIGNQQLTGIDTNRSEVHVPIFESCPSMSSVIRSTALLNTSGSAVQFSPLHCSAKNVSDCMLTTCVYAKKPTTHMHCSSHPLPPNSCPQRLNLSQRGSLPFFGQAQLSVLYQSQTLTLCASPSTELA